MNEELQAVADTNSLVGMGQAVNNLVGQGLGTGLLMVVFVIGFYRLSGEGYIPAIAASSFITMILGFILAAGSMVPVQLPFLIAAGSAASVAYMYMNQRV